MCLNAIVWVTLPLDHHDMPTYLFMKYFAASKLSVVRVLLEGDRRSADVPLISPSSPEGDEKHQLDDATEYSSGWVSPFFGGDRWHTSSGTAETTATTSCRQGRLRLCLLSFSVVATGATRRFLSRCFLFSMHFLFRPFLFMPFPFKLFLYEMFSSLGLLYTLFSFIGICLFFSIDLFLLFICLVKGRFCLGLFIFMEVFYLYLSIAAVLFF